METEIKLRVDDEASIRQRIEALGFTILHPRIFEGNDIYDTPDLELRATRCLLRVRDAGAQCVLTFKGPPQPGRHKSREEIETKVDSAEALARIVERLGFQRWFRYEKYRTEYHRTGEDGILTFDETPIGVFLELEGEADWIDRTARDLGVNESDYITASYFGLYEQHCREHGLVRKDMVFSTEDRRTT